MKIKILEDLYGMVSRLQCVYLIIDRDKQLILVDTGYFGYYKKIFKYVKQLGFKPEDIKHVLITHADGDHIGSLKKIKQYTNARIYASKKAEEYLTSGTNPRHLPSILNYFIQILSRVLIKPSKIDCYFEDGSEISLAGGIEVIRTPGHTDDHYSFWWKEKKVLFSGDVFTNFKKIQVSHSVMNFDNVAIYSSAKKLIDLNPKIICVGHGVGVWTERKKQELEELKSSISLNLNSNFP